MLLGHGEMLRWADRDAGRAAILLTKSNWASVAIHAVARLRSGRAPMRARGLKHRERGKLVRMNGSRPTRARGFDGVVCLTNAAIPILPIASALAIAPRGAVSPPTRLCA